MLPDLGPTLLDRAAHLPFGSTSKESASAIFTVTVLSMLDIAGGGTGMVFGVAVSTIGRDFPTEHPDTTSMTIAAHTDQAADRCPATD